MNDVRPTIDTIFSIVIPTLNEEKYVPHLLEDLCNQTMDHRLFEVIVVDGSSKDKTVSETEKYSNLINLRIVRAKKANVSLQRNLGAKFAKSPWVIFMDADNNIPKSFLDGIKYQLANNPKTKCFTCWIDENIYKTADKPLITMTNLSIDILAKIQPFAPGSLIGTTRELAHKYPFDQKLGMSEDHEFVRKLVKNMHHFSVFRFPKYHLSLRRLEREGTLKLLRTYSKAQLYLLMGRHIKVGEVDYPMGGNIQKVEIPWKKTASFQLKNTFSDLMKHHKKTAKKLLDWLTLSQ